MKKITIILVLVLSLMTVFDSPEISADGVSDLMIADFTQDATYNNVQNIARLSHTKRAGLSGDSSGRYILNGGGTGVGYNLANVDFSNHNVLNFWAYNDGYGDTETDASKQFVMVLKSNGGTEWATNLAYKEFKLDWKGWKKFSVSFDSFTFLGTFNWSNVTLLHLRPGMLKATAVTDYWDDVFFDRIWLSNSDPGLLICDLNSDTALAKYNILGSKTSGFTKDETVSHYYDFSGKFTAAANQNVIFYNDANNTFDMTKYTHLNFAMYSDKDTSSDITRMTVFIYSADGGWYKCVADAKWEGWNLVSLPLEKFSIGANSTTVALKDCTAVKGVRLMLEKNPMNAQINFDRFAFVNGVPAALSAKDFSVENGAKNVPLTNKKITLSYNNALSEYLKPSSVSVTKDGETVTNYVAGTKENEIEIFFDSLDAGSEYTVSINNVVDINGNTQSEAKVLNFKTEGSQLELCGDIGFKDKNGSVITSLNGTDSVYAACEIKNNTSSEKSVFVVTAVYTDNGKQLAGVACDRKKIDAGSTAEIDDVGLDITPESGYTAKVFVFDSAESIRPVFNMIGSIGY